MRCRFRRLRGTHGATVIHGFWGVREPGVALIPLTAFGDATRGGNNGAQKRSGLPGLRVAR